MKKEKMTSIDLDLPQETILFAIQEGLFAVNQVTLTPKGVKMLTDYLNDPKNGNIKDGLIATAAKQKTKKARIRTIKNKG